MTFSTSRYRKAKVMDGLAVTLLMALMAAPQAKADTIDDQITNYVERNGVNVCLVLDEYPSTAGLIGVMQAIASDGWTPYEAGQIAAMSVFMICPGHLDILDRFIAIYGDKGAVA